MFKELYFHQARWFKGDTILEPLVFELSAKGRVGHVPSELGEELQHHLEEALREFPKELLRIKDPDLPELSEVEVVRHFVRLSQMNLSVDLTMYPLGSCTMKYTPKVMQRLSHLTHDLHPYQPDSTVQGLLEILYELEKWLCELTGMERFSLQPAAGAHGEFTGINIIRAYHKLKGELEKREEIIIPDSAHGTNPASASMGGFRIVTIPTNEKGSMDLNALKSVLSERTAGAMITVPNTLGIFEEEIDVIAEMVHEAGGVMYMDGANMNALLCKVRPADLGFDIIHLNLHKTFASPHGGGGPGSGPIGVKKELVKFLPVPLIDKRNGKYFLNYDVPNTIGKVRSFYGNIEVLLKAYIYILLMGEEGLSKVSDIAVLNSNYLFKKLTTSMESVFEPVIAPERLRKHEFVVSIRKLREKKVTAADVSKRIIDHGFYPPIIYFPLIVKEDMMIEPTETETKEVLDEYAKTLFKIARETMKETNKVKNSPFSGSITRLDEVRASRHPILSWKMYKKLGNEGKVNL